MQLQGNNLKADLVRVLRALIDKDKHHLQKNYKISVE